jgi:hypothetical protein
MAEPESTTAEPATDLEPEAEPRAGGRRQHATADVAPELFGGGR